MTTTTARNSRTYRLRAGEMDRRWHVIDASGRPLGRVAGEAARLLMGKHKPTYEPYLPMGDFVVIVNAREIALTGNKAQQKVYYRHSGYPGGLKTRTFQEQMQRDPRRVVERAIKGMLPSTSLGRELFRHLKVYAGPTHPHEAQVRAGTGARARKRAQSEGSAAVTATAPRSEEPTMTNEQPNTPDDQEQGEKTEQAIGSAAILGPAGIPADPVDPSPAPPDATTGDTRTADEVERDEQQQSE